MIKRTALFLLLVLPLNGSDNRVKRGPFRKVLVLAGELRASVAEKVFTPRTDTWRVQIKWMIDEGEIVAPGEPVVRFDNSGMADKLESLQSEIRAKQQELTAQQTETDNNLREAQLLVQTHKIELEKATLDASIPEILIEKRKYQEYQLNLMKAQKELETTRKAHAATQINAKDKINIIKIALEAKQRELLRRQKILEALEVRARTGGVVIYSNFGWQDRKVQLGDTMQATWPVMYIPDLKTLEVESFVSETDLAFVSIGQIAAMQLDAYPEQAFSGQVIGVSRKGEIREQWGEAAWFKLRVTLDQVDLGRMRPGMSIRLSLLVQQEQDVLLLPAAFVRRRNTDYYVTPKGSQPVAVTVIGINPFDVATPLNGPLKEGMELR